MANPDILLSRLKKVKKTGSNSWIACCPAHDDKSPSMTIRSVDDGKILAYCFAGCGIEAITGAVGLNVSELMPDKQPDVLRASRAIPFSPSDVLACVKSDASLIYIVMCDLDKGLDLTKEQLTNAKKAAARIYSAAELGGQ